MNKYSQDCRDGEIAFENGAPCAPPSNLHTSRKPEWVRGWEDAHKWRKFAKNCPWEDLQRCSARNFNDCARDNCAIIYFIENWKGDKRNPEETR